MSRDQRRGIMGWDWQNGASREEWVYLPWERGLHMCMHVSVCGKFAHAGLKWMDETREGLDT